MSDHAYVPRFAAGLLRKALQASPVVVVMGARQTGKSTLVRSEPSMADRLYLTLDDMDVLERARTIPDDLVRSAPRLTLDEVQRDPDLLLAVKRAVDMDRPRRNGRFVLTGSANLLLMRSVSESLAGRATYVNLWPLARRERLGRGMPGIWSALLSTPMRKWHDLVDSQDDAPASWRESVRESGYPTPALELDGQESRALWFDGYVRTYLERDLQMLSAVADLVDFQRLMRAAGHRLGGLVNQAEIARDTRIPRATVQRHLNLLETSFQTIRLPSYSVNRTKRLIKPSSSSKKAATSAFVKSTTLAPVHRLREHYTLGFCRFPGYSTNPSTYQTTFSMLLLLIASKPSSEANTVAALCQQAMYPMWPSFASPNTVPLGCSLGSCRCARHGDGDDSLPLIYALIESAQGCSHARPADAAPAIRNMVFVHPLIASSCAFLGIRDSLQPR